jgi:hypothetical protein
LNLRQDEYEYTQDLRKVYKMSLSYVIAYAVNRFLDKIVGMFTLEEYMGEIDNLLYRNYVISYKLIGGIHCWKYCWGYTPWAYT